MDPAKLKVVELRAELQSRGLDTKGNKPVLVKRLKEALEAELETELPDTSIADTSTEDCGSQDEDCMVSESQEAPVAVDVPETEIAQSVEPAAETAPELTPEPVQEAPAAEKIPEAAPEPVQAPAAEKIPEAAPEDPSESVVEPDSIAEASAPSPKVEEEKQPEKQDQVQSDKDESETQPQPEVQQQLPENVAQEVPKSEEAVPQEKVEQNGDNTNGDTEEDVGEPKAKKSRWGTETETAIATTDNEAIPAAIDESEAKDQKEDHGEKRKHSSPSPERNQRQRSKSPIREDEPVIDANKVQLSWYDSDLHLQIDKTSFLSAKPLHDGLFGYIWSGARATHGVKVNKACYEVKIVEELQFEDILSSTDRRDNRRERRDSRRDERERSRTKSENGGERSEKPAQVANKSDEKQEQDADAAAKPEPMETDPAADKETTDAESTNAEAAEVPDKQAQDSQDNSRVEPSEEKADDAAETKEAATVTKPADPPAPEPVKIPSHLIRIGWSHVKSSLQLGEDKLSFGLESSGKFYANKTKVDTGFTFKVGDVVTAFVDMSSKLLSFAINGAFVYEHQIELSEDENLDDFALFPHVITRNLTFEINTGDREEAFSTIPEGYEAYSFVSKLDEKVCGPRTPEKREDCEVIVMVGLPAAGKTYWVNEYIKTAEKTYNIIGSSFLMDRMNVDGNSIRTSICTDRLSFFLNKLQKSTSRLSDIAPLRRRDFILDQTNVFPTAIRRKLRSFLGFKRHAVIVVNEEEEQEKRMKQQHPETGKDMSMSALLEMKANMGLPKVGENLEQATYVSLPEDKALEQVQKYNKQGRASGGFGNSGHHRREYRDDRNNRWHQRGSSGNGGGPRRDYQHRDNYRDRPYQTNRYDRNYRQGSSGGGGGGGGWRPGGSGAGNWMPRNDRRDNRGPRDWRNNNRSGGGMNDRQHNRGGNRDHRSQSNNSGGNYNRNRNQSSGGGGRWGGQSGGWNSQSNSGGGGGGSWSGGQGQDWNSGWNQSQGSWNQNQWKYGGGYNQGGYSQYPQNWNSGYYGGNTYSQDWSGSNAGGHDQGGSSAQATSVTTNTSNSTSSYAPSSSMIQGQQQQDAWAHYAHQYTQGTTTNSNAQK